MPIVLLIRARVTSEQHGGEASSRPGDVLDSHSLLKRQSVNYQERFPDAFCADEFEKQLWKEQHYPQPVTIGATPLR